MSHKICIDCSAMCCKNLAVHILKPRTREEIDELKWQLHFDTVQVYVSNKRWYLHIEGKCMYLGKNNLCTIYDKRPDKCRNHNLPDCEIYGKYFDVMMHTPDDLEEYIAKEKKAKKKKSARPR